SGLTLRYARRGSRGGVSTVKRRRFARAARPGRSATDCAGPHAAAAKTASAPVSKAGVASRLRWHTTHRSYVAKPARPMQIVLEIGSNTDPVQTLAHRLRIDFFVRGIIPGGGHSTFCCPLVANVLFEPQAMSHLIHRSQRRSGGHELSDR